MNNGDGTFADPPIALPGGDNKNTWAIAAADVNGDGYVDIIIGNYGQRNQVVMNNGNDEVNSNENFKPSCFPFPKGSSAFSTFLIETLLLIFTLPFPPPFLLTIISLKLKPTIAIFESPPYIKLYSGF